MVFTSVFEDSHPDEKFQNSLSLYYWHQLDKYSNKTLFIDYESGRQWTGREIKSKAVQVAKYLVAYLEAENDSKKNNNCVFFYKNSDYIHITAMGALFAGCSVCAGAHDDPKPEQKYMIELLEPCVVFADANLLDRLVDIRGELNLSFKIIILNDYCDKNLKQSILDNNLTSVVAGLHRHIFDQINSYQNNCTEENESKLPIVVGPDSPAYILLTSGSTGKPKPVARTHKNSVYVCHCLDTCSNELWDLNEGSVFAGHLPLDHGTGTFSIKMTLSKGMQLIIMENYYQHMLLEAIDKYKITDCILGSALLHNLMVNLLKKEGEDSISSFKSMRNFISVGSPIPSHELAVKFMQKYPECSVRQSLGMTECGFISFVRRSDCLKESKTVGWLLPNLKIKLMESSSEELIKNDNSNSNHNKSNLNNLSNNGKRKEITDFDKEGEMFLGGPTVSTGYVGEKYLEQQKLAFMSDGFYRTFDICMIKPDGQIIIKGRCNDILCLGDGWKVLPAEIERVLMTHPAILEAAVIGIPHPNLPTCHAPRAYIVPKNPDWFNEETGSRLTELDVCKFAENHLSEPKHLAGGVCIMNELPKIGTLGKVDKRALRKMDGF